MIVKMMCNHKEVSTEIEKKIYKGYDQPEIYVD